MKICAIGLRGIPDIMGGIESHCQQLYPRMVKNDVSVTVIARSPYVEQKNYMFEGVQVISVWTLKHKFLETFMHTFFAIIYARIFVHPDVIHLHAIGPALFTPLARLLGMKVVVTHHGADYDRQKWNGFAKFILKAGEKMGVFYGNKMFVVGKTLTARLKQQFPNHADKIEYIPNGMLPSFSGDISSDFLPKELGLIHHQYVLAVGRLVPEKGFHDLVNAYKTADSKLKLVIVGDADHQDDYSISLRKESSEDITFAGRRSGNELKALYKHARVFVLPSYHEGLPIVALEAISAGTNVLLSDIAPNVDIEAPIDSYFPVGDTISLSSKITNVESLSLEMNQNEFLQKFNWDVIAQSTQKFITQLFENKGK
ncbi:glycosyltransferase family 4 protein [Alteromonas stellipolaris]|uniref:glycosyltransferase family 4 protein n=1 Tax=Alteromonas stellipolaris TaxID=233316 RepID=UPI002735D919|nr:glycosyltransferase family 4 protein [Alteromonas stellipolaris]MDP2537243.1 glycosyltransferase family 4 protein [Alteromonas stellipolaris]